MNNLLKSKEARTSFVSLLIVLIIFGMVFASAQNSSEENVEEIIDLCADITCEDSELECPDEVIVSCSNTCDSETGGCSECEPDCAGHEFSNSIQPLEANESSAPPVVNESVDETGNESEVQQQEEISPEEIEEENAEISVVLFYPDKIIRADVVEVEATITNSKAVAKDVVATWIVPKGFEIISGEIMHCGDLTDRENCISVVVVQTSVETGLGINEIKVEVGFDDE